MKNYKKYMEGVNVSDTLHEKLKNLETKKKTSMWQKYAVAAAAFTLVVCLGAWGLFRGNNADLPGSTELGEPIGETAEAPAIEPGVAPPVPMPNSPGMEMMGGYEVSYGETVAYYMLPLIRYGEVSAPEASDLALPVGVHRYDLTEEEILALLGGESNIVTHLNWNEYTLYAYAMLHRDGSLWMLEVAGRKSDTEHFSLTVMPGEIPSSCYAYPETVTNNIWERDVMAVSYGNTRCVAFVDRAYGYRFEVSNGDDELVSRLVRFVLAGGGLRFASDSAEPIEPALPGGEMTTEPYDPDEPIPTPAPVVTPEP